jgi:hypothetical protein
MEIAEAGYREQERGRDVTTTPQRCATERDDGGDADCK